MVVWALVLWALGLGAAQRPEPQPRDLSALWEAAGREPKNADVQNELGEMLERLGALDAAIDAFQRALAAKPDFRKASNNLILALVKAGRGAEAVARARAEAATAPDDPERLFTLGLAQSEQDVEGAIVTFRRVLTVAPRHALARYNLALALNRVDRTDEAIAELQRVVETAPRAEAHYTLGVIRLHRGELDRAAASLRAAIAAQPDHAEAYHVLGSVLQAQQNLPDAITALRRAIVLRPDLSAAHYTLGRVLQATGDAPGARRHFAEAERLRREAQAEQQARALTSAGITTLERGDAAGALDAFRRAVAASSGYAPAHFQMGRALEVLGQTEAAAAAFARAQALNPSLRRQPGERPVP